MGWVAPIIMAAGSLYKGFSTMQADDYNAHVARQNAQYAASAGSVQAANVSLRGAQQQGHILAGQGANNVTVYDPAKGASTVNVQKTSREGTVQGATNTENNALLKAYGYNAQASLDKYEGQSAMIGSVFEAAGDIAGGWGAMGGGGGSTGGSGPSSTGSPTGQALQDSANSDWVSWDIQND